MPSFNLPPSRFTKDTTYHSALDRMSNHSETLTVPIRVKRDLGGSALVGNNNGSSPLAGILERAANRARLAHKQDYKVDDERSIAEELYAFPDPTVAENELRTSTTPESEREALEMYESVRDDQLLAMIDEFAGHDVHAEEVQRLLRENNALRTKLGSYLRAKLEHPAFWGHEKSQVARNIIKQSTLGYGKIQSRDYVTQLALAMLDGTFKSERISRAEYSEVDSKGIMKDGEHRIAAKVLLRFPRPEESSKVVEKPQWVELL